MLALKREALDGDSGFGVEGQSKVEDLGLRVGNLRSGF